MKNKLTFLLLFCSTYLLQAQVLYNETFDTFTVGPLSADPTGATPGQDNWYTDEYYYNTGTPERFAITNEPNKGKVLTLTTVDPVTKDYKNYTAQKKNINTLIDNRTAGNNVIKFEIEFFTGPQNTFTGSPSNPTNYISINTDNNYFANNSTILFSFKHFTNDGRIEPRYSNGDGTAYAPQQNIQLNKHSKGTPYATLPFNTWIKLNVYLDYNKKKIYFETPYFNAVVGDDFLHKSISTNLIQDHKPTSLTFAINTNFGNEALTSTHQIVSKFNNIKITALNTVPLHVSEFLNEKFTVYPNPATNVVNFSTTDNLAVTNVKIYDVSGKLLKTISTIENNAINIESLATGTYLLHLKTNIGTAVKKIVKQ